MTRTTSDLEGALHAARSPYATDTLAPTRLTAIRAGGRRRRRARTALGVGGVAAAVVLVAGAAVAVTSGVGGTPAPGPVDRTSQAPERPDADRDRPVGTLVVDDSTPFGAAVADDLRVLRYSGRPFAEGLRVGGDRLSFGCRSRGGLDDCLPAWLDDDGTAQRLVWRFADVPGEGMDVYLTERSSALGRTLIAHAPVEAASVDVFIGGGVVRGEVDAELGGGTVMWVRGIGRYPERVVARDAAGLVVAEQVLPGR